MRKWKLASFGTAALLAGASLPLCCFSGCGTEAGSAPPAQQSAPQDRGGAPAERVAAKYSDEGQLLLPQNHREWMFIGAPVTPHDMNDGKAAFPEFHNVYIDPVSFAAYRKTGRFPGGTVILKETVSVGAKSMASGNGYFQGEFASLEAMVKDEARFTDEPGGWAFFRFGEAPDYDSIGARMKTEDCNSCHAGASEDYVFSETYPVLRAARPKLPAE
ncbi:MAG: cytochrome P460 family protein [Planctomycetaceae bacterium]|nr:cytochrome P460 family protein [Planctomycetaceae bacterium]